MAKKVVFLTRVVKTYLDKYPVIMDIMKVKDRGQVAVVYEIWSPVKRGPNVHVRFKRWNPL